MWPLMSSSRHGESLSAHPFQPRLWSGKKKQGASVSSGFPGRRSRGGSPAPPAMFAPYPAPHTWQDDRFVVLELLCAFRQAGGIMR